ncbi:hypothetical protein PIB30_000453 [Stylosanthes scabra]|uniref:Secreted protein n=1 Tax=Stylosanthes scabra TaxID=79078 RepID=A0ABU6V4E3_9FABA|nr:hypothetical protein [Stylosanthes scabra]
MKTSSMSPSFVTLFLLLPSLLPRPSSYHSPPKSAATTSAPLSPSRRPFTFQIRSRWPVASVFQIFAVAFGPSRSRSTAFAHLPLSLSAATAFDELPSA